MTYLLLYLYIGLWIACIDFILLASAVRLENKRTTYLVETINLIGAKLSFLVLVSFVSVNALCTIFVWPTVIWAWTDRGHKKVI